MLTNTLPPEALIFDLDGTLFKTETLSLAAYHMTFDQLRKEGLFTGKTPPEERFLQSLGLLLPTIWKNVLPSSSHSTRSRANTLLLEYQIQLLTQGHGELYCGVKKTLKTLFNNGYALFVASNGLEAYVKGVIQAMELSHLFTALYSAGQFQTTSKGELVKLLVRNYRLSTAWMCGDRLSDVEAGKENGLLVVGCAYGGFHSKTELQHADLIIDSFPALLAYLPWSSQT